MGKPLIRIPYTHPLPPPTIIPASAKTLSGAVTALQEFLQSPSSQLHSRILSRPPSTVVLTGAGLSVASGLADYRGVNGTYRVNKTYRPIYYHEYTASHEARKRYWARSFLGWATMSKSKPNAAHFALRDLGELGFLSSVITQNVDSFHPRAHPEIPTLELHGYLRATVCTSCRNEFPREAFQEELARLNPAWAEFLKTAIESGALETEDPEEKRARGIKMNPDGDVDVPGAPYTTFRYPACPTCLAKPPPIGFDGTSKGVVEVDQDGAWKAGSNAGILKPNVIMFGESIPSTVKVAAEEVVDGAKNLLVLGTSLATYSAWRLVKRAKERGMPIAAINVGGVRGEDVFFSDLDPTQTGKQGVRTEVSTESLLPALVRSLRPSKPSTLKDQVQ
ncbi:SIR2 family histone deacetylase-like protein [Podospora australis]|uniref:SIR2 family histone deacetylase-like protein n=1 Tax=Podospora australis TaxID=1536484 RepID=A0AAN6X4A4_9PEZI|nr:SIR2 family histone deacetylase-like protein [Podospora australis]